MHAIFLLLISLKVIAYAYLQVNIVDWSTPGDFPKSLQVPHLAHGLLMPTCVVETIYGKNMLTSTNQFYQKKEREDTWYLTVHKDCVVVMEIESVGLLYY